MQKQSVMSLQLCQSCKIANYIKSMSLMSFLSNKLCERYGANHMNLPHTAIKCLSGKNILAWECEVKNEIYSSLLSSKKNVVSYWQIFGLQTYFLFYLKMYATVLLLIFYSNWSYGCSKLIWFHLMQSISQENLNIKTYQSISDW